MLMERKEELAEGVTLYLGDCLYLLPTLDENSVDACVTDPPYHLTSMVKRLSRTNVADVEKNFTKTVAGQAANPFQSAARGFMGKEWDGGDIAFRVELWSEVYRVLKPGAHLLAFGGTRTFGRMQVAIEDAGFEIRDTIMWLYGSGFPKSHDVSKGIDRAAGAEREVIGIKSYPREGTTPVTRKATSIYSQGGGENVGQESNLLTAPATDAAREWEGWGTALKPAQEPICVAQKPLTINQFYAIILAYITEGLGQWLNLNASDVAKNFSALQVMLHGAGSSVLANARICALASIEPALSAAVPFTSIELGSTDQERIRVDVAQLLAKQLSSAERRPGLKTDSGVAVDTSIRIMDMCTSVMRGDTSESIASLWLNISDALLREANKFTIEMVSRSIIALKTLNCLLRPNIGSDIGNLFPNCEPVVLARKPLSESTVAANVLKWGTGALNIDGCRVRMGGNDRVAYEEKRRSFDGVVGTVCGDIIGMNASPLESAEIAITRSIAGRWPANVILSYPEDQYALRRDITAEERRELFRWFHENA